MLLITIVLISNFLIVGSQIVQSVGVDFKTVTLYFSGFLDSHIPIPDTPQTNVSKKPLHRAPKSKIKMDYLSHSEAKP